MSNSHNLRLLDKLLQHSVEKYAEITPKLHAKNATPPTPKIGRGAKRRGQFCAPPVSRFCAWICEIAREFSSECCNNLSNNRNSGWSQRNRLIPGPFCTIFHADSESGLKIDFFEKSSFFHGRTPLRGRLRSKTIVNANFYVFFVKLRKKTNFREIRVRAGGWHGVTLGVTLPAPRAHPNLVKC